MGADIHFVIEKARADYEDGRYIPNGKGWIGVYATYDTPRMIRGNEPLPRAGDTSLHDKSLGMKAYDREMAMKDRNYEFFAKLAGVRGDGPEPRGFPEDASELAVYLGEPDRNTNWHSHSWATLEEFATLWLESQSDEVIAGVVESKLKGRFTHEDLMQYITGCYLYELSLYRVLYWFDN